MTWTKITNSWYRIPKVNRFSTWKRISNPKNNLWTNLSLFITLVGPSNLINWTLVNLQIDQVEMGNVITYNKYGCLIEKIYPHIIFKGDYVMNQKHYNKFQC